MPITTAILVSFIKPILIVRFFIVCLPALVLLVSAGLAQLRNVRLFAAALGLLVVLSIANVAYSYAHQDKQDWRGATAYLMSRSASGDAIVFFGPWNQEGFDYYYNRSNDSSQAISIEQYTTAETEKAAANPVYYGFGRLPEPDQQISQRLSPKYDRVWLVLALNSDAGRKNLGMDDKHARWSLI